MASLGTKNRPTSWGLRALRTTSCSDYRKPNRIENGSANVQQVLAPDNLGQRGVKNVPDGPLSGHDARIHNAVRRDGELSSPTMSAKTRKARTP